MEDISITCPVLPDVSQLKQELMNKWQQEVFDILQNTSFTNTSSREGGGAGGNFPNPPSLLSTLSTIHPDYQAQICSNILFQLLFSTFITENSTSLPPPNHHLLTLVASSTVNLEIPLTVKLQLLLLLKACPSAAKIADAQGYLLIHYLVLMELPDRDVLRFLCFSYPASLGIYFQTPDHLVITPFHCILLKNEVDFELALWMITIFPKAARDEITGGKLPLHLVMTCLVHDEMEEEFQMKLLKKLLMEYPSAAFKEITEEIRVMRLSEVRLTDNGTRNERQFTMQVQTSVWTPAERAKKSSDEKTRSLFHKFVEHIGYRHLQSKIRK